MLPWAHNVLCIVELHVTGYKNIECVAMKMEQCVSLLLLSHMPLLTIYNCWVWPWKHNSCFPLHCCCAKQYFILLSTVQTCLGRHVKCLIRFSEFNFHKSVHCKNILIYIQQDATLHSLFHPETALHILGGTTRNM